MAGDQHRRQRRFAPRQFGDHVARGQLANAAPFEGQGQRHRLAPLPGRDPGDQVGVGIGNGAGRDRSGPGGPTGRAGVRVAVQVGADRADHHCGGALGRGHRRPLPPRLAIGTIARAILRCDHRMVDEGDPALQRPVRSGLQRVQAGEIDQLASQPARRGRRAVTQRGDGKVVRERRGQLRPLRSAHPAGDGEGFDADVGEAQRLETGDSPVARRRFALGAGQALADLGGQALGDVPGDAAALHGLGNCGAGEDESECAKCGAGNGELHCGGLAVCSRLAKPEHPKGNGPGIAPRPVLSWLSRADQ